MTTLRFSLFLAASLPLMIGACSKKAEEPATAASSSAAIDHKDPVQSAMAAAPASVSGKATIVAAEADGSMKTLREGSNGWTCMPDSPATPGPDPMCMDASAMAWAGAWMAHKPPPTDQPGVMYMLEGGTDASNTDPYATKPTEGSDWIKTGAHMMIVGSQAVLKGYPSGASPDTGAPYVMWAGTPYAHLMIPVN